MKYRLHTTTDYHTGKIQTLGWEWTLCNMLWSAQSPCRKILRKPDSYGHLLFDHLARFLPIPSIRRVIEIGGGYGYLMKDLLERFPVDRLMMIDISPALLQRQMATLAGRDCEFFCEDFLATPECRLAGMDLAILNENLGDFPTLVGLDETLFAGAPDALEGPLPEARRLFDVYRLSPPQDSPFCLNLGALQALEKLCLAGIPFIFVGEHSCEAKVPKEMRGLIPVRSSGNPERIALYGHEEYTIRFSDLERLATSLGYSARRGAFADFLPWDLTVRVKRILSSHIDMRDDDEAIRQFIGDLYQYEYLLLCSPQSRVSF